MTAALLDRWASQIQEMMVTSSEQWRIVFHVFSNTGVTLAQSYSWQTMLVA